MEEQKEEEPDLEQAKVELVNLSCPDQKLCTKL